MQEMNSNILPKVQCLVKMVVSMCEQNSLLFGVMKTINMFEMKTCWIVVINRRIDRISEISTYESKKGSMEIEHELFNRTRNFQ